MARPTTSNPSSTSSDAGTDTLTWNHTAESGKNIWVIVASAQNGQTSSTLTFGSSAAGARKLFFFTGVTVVFHNMEVWIIENPTPGAANLEWIANAASNRLAVIAFNVADGGNSAILPGVTDTGFVSTPITQKAYGWDAEGLIIAFAWGQSNAQTCVITQGTEIDSVGGLVANEIDATDTDQDVTYTKGAGVAACDGGAFMIPPAIQSRTSGTYFPFSTGAIDLSNVDVGVIAYSGLPYGGNYIPDRIANIYPVSGTLRSWQINSNIAPGAGNEVTVELMLGVDALESTGIILTISDTDTTSPAGAGDGIDFAHYKYDRLSLKITNTGAGILPGDFSIRASFIDEPGVANNHAFGGGILSFGSGVLDGEIDKAALHPSGLIWGTFPNSEKSLVGLEGAFTEYVASYQRVNQPSGFLNYDYYFRLNGILQDGAGGTVDTTAALQNGFGQALTRWQGSLPVIPRDYIANVNIQRTASAFYLRHAVVSVFVPTVSGKFMISGHGGKNFSGGSSGYSAQFNSSGFGAPGEQEAIADEAKTLLIIPPLTAVGGPLKIEGMVNDLSGSSPGSGKSLTQDLRVNLANSGIQIVLSDAQDGDDVAGDVDVVEGDSIDTIWTPTNTPNANLQFWSIPGSSTSLGTIIVQKNAQGNTTADFTFTTGGGLSPGTFTLQGGTQQIFSDIPAGSGYTLDESGIPSGWQLESVFVNNGSTIGNITVTTGETVIVIFTNSLITPANNPSGLYELIPGKTDDTIWVDVTLGVDQDVPIP